MKFAFVLVLLLSTLFASAAPTANAVPDAVAKDFFIYLLAGKENELSRRDSPMTVLLTPEDGAWLVDEIQCHKSKFSEEGTLRTDLRELAAKK